MGRHVAGAAAWIPRGTSSPHDRPGHAHGVRLGHVPVPFLRDRRKNASAVLALVAQAVLAVAVVRALGWSAYLLAVALPLAIAMASGAYLFYAQHNFPGVFLQPRDQWNYIRAALESSSYMPMGPVIRSSPETSAFTTCTTSTPRIPFYRLPEAMRAIPELQNPRTTTLSPRASSRVSGSTSGIPSSVA